MTTSPDSPRCLITGAGGFLGSYLAELMLEKGYAVHGAVHKDSRNLAHISDQMSLLPCDMLDKGQVKAAVLESRPQLIFHLAAQSLPFVSWKDPEHTLEANVLGTLHLLEAVRTSGIKPTILLAGSSAEYGFAAPNEVPIAETAPLHPASPYGVSKVAADLLGQLYARTYDLRVICLRPFFIIGPRKVDDVCSDFARGIVSIEAGRQAKLAVGNVEATRDFLDVADAIEACWLVAQSGKPGDVYNVCSGMGHSIREILDTLCSLATKPIPVELDPTRLRPSDEPIIVGDNRRLRRLGWSLHVPLAETLARILQYWRNVQIAGES